jgi:hypothetical protein
MIKKKNERPPIQGIVAKTVGELRAALATLPDDMPIHHRGNRGDFPPGASMVLLTLAQANADPDYFAAIEIDSIWSRPRYKDEFGTHFQTLCIVGG